MVTAQHVRSSAARLVPTIQMKSAMSALTASMLWWKMGNVSASTTSRTTSLGSCRTSSANVALVMWRAVYLVLSMPPSVISVKIQKQLSLMEFVCVRLTNP